MKENRRPFDIKYRSDIEAGRYRVETRDGRPARIVCWDVDMESKPSGTIKPILALHKEDDGEYAKHHFGNGKLWLNDDDEYDLFLVPVEQEKQTHPVRKHNSSPAVKEILDSITNEDVQKAKEEMEKEIEQDACTITGWVARDDDGDVKFYVTKPHRSKVGPYWTGDDLFELFRDDCPSLRWDDEPIEVTLTIKRKEDSK